MRPAAAVWRGAVPVAGRSAGQQGRARCPPLPTGLGRGAADRCGDDTHTGRPSAGSSVQRESGLPALALRGAGLRRWPPASTRRPACDVHSGSLRGARPRKPRDAPRQVGKRSALGRTAGCRPALDSRLPSSPESRSHHFLRRRCSPAPVSSGPPAACGSARRLGLPHTSPGLCTCEFLCSGCVSFWTLSSSSSAFSP